MRSYGRRVPFDFDERTRVCTVDLGRVAADVETRVELSGVDGEVVRCFKGEVKGGSLEIPPNDAVVFELARHMTKTK